jgi:GTPase SAR1 family protein
MTNILDLSIKNVYTKRNNSKILPKSIRACIIGKSGCGKTNLLMNLLLNKFSEDDYLDYNNLFIFSKSLHQPEYKLLIKGIENGLTKKQILKCILTKKFTIDKNNENKSTIQIHYFNDSDEIPDPTEIDPDLKTLIIFDDVLLEKQNKVESYYTRGRHNNVDCFYISQNYIKLPKNTIRENANFFILFEQDHRNKSYFFSDHCGDLKKEEFFDLCTKSWSEEFGFVTLDKTSKINYGKYRKMLNYFLVN